MAVFIDTETVYFNCRNIGVFADHRKTINCPKHVWAIDMIYVPMRHGFVSLSVVLD